MSISIKKFKIGLPLKLIIMIVVVLAIGDSIHMEIKSFFYAVSLSIKEVLVFLLPIIIFSYLTSCMLSFQKGVVTFVSILLITAFLSNFISFMLSYGTCSIFLEKITSGTQLSEAVSKEIFPAWKFTLPELISNRLALISGLIAGIFFSYRPNDYVTHLANKLKNFSDFFLGKIFIPLVPLFILGFLIKLQDEGQLTSVLTTYGPIFLLALAAEGLYIIFLFGLFFNFEPQAWFAGFRNAFPSAIVAFSSMSSAGAMPLVLDGAKHNTASTKHPELFRVLVPASTNIHMIGNSMTVPLLALSILFTFGLPLPSFSTYTTFAFFASIAAYAAAGTPGGGLVIMYSLLKYYLGLTDEMISLITTLYLLFDPLLTAINVLGNGIYAVFFTKLFSKLRVNQ